MFAKYKNRIFNINECVLIEYVPRCNALRLQFRDMLSVDRNGKPHNIVRLVYDTPQMAAFAYGRLFIALQFGWAHVNLTEESLQRVLNRIEAQRT